MISVIIPTYNSSRHICEAVDSVLTQTYKNFEIIVVDDGSSDDTREVLKKYNEKIRYIFQKNSGPGIARNKGIEIANGEFIAFLDADDAWLPDKLFEQVKIFERDGDAALVYCNGVFVDAIGNILNKKTANTTASYANQLKSISFIELVNRRDIYPSLVLVRKKILQDFGSFEPLYLNEEYFLWLKIAYANKVYFLDKVLVRRKYLSQSLSHLKPKTSRIAELKGFKVAGTMFPKFRRSFKRKLAKSRYILGRSEFSDKHYWRAYLCLKAAISANPFVGLLFCQNSDSIVQVVKKIIAPFILIFFLRLPEKYKIKVANSLKETSWD